MKRNSGMSMVLYILIGLIGVVILSCRLAASGALPSMDLLTLGDTATSSLLTVTAPHGAIYSLMATSSVDKEKGLGGRFSLPADEGMLFVFSPEGEYGFWMKDTLIPLDIVWIKADKTVAGVAYNVMPDTYPQIFLPPQPILYVLELNASAAEKFGIATGTPLQFVI
jgi:uncharacterized membrane protein (UPF0127 family)